MTLLTRPAPDDPLPDALAAWRAEPAATAEPLYRARVFPHAAERMRALADESPAVTLLFAPVGTQPYAPVLAALATRAESVVLLHTAFTRPHAELAREALLPDRPDTALAAIGDGTEPAPIARAVFERVASRGVLRPTQVMIDVTGGRKATSAVLGALAAVQGYRQAYVEGTPDRVHRAFFVDERLVELPNVALLVGADERKVAFALLERGLLREAADRLRAPSALGLSTPLALRLGPLLDALLEGREAVGPALDALAELPASAVEPLRAWLDDATAPLEPALQAFTDALRVEGYLE